MNAAPKWTDADQAELDVLTFELVRSFFEHRERCPACQPAGCPAYLDWGPHLEECPACRGDAPMSYRPRCPRRQRMVEHSNGCPRCNPCPELRTAIEVILEWRKARELRSRAEWLRAERERNDNAA